MKRLLLILILFFQSIIFCNPIDLDTSFNLSGPIPGTITDTKAQVTFATILQPDGKIITAGWGSLNYGYDSLYLARYLSNGKLDTVENGGSGFGLRELGYINIQLFLNPAISDPVNANALAMALQPNGDIVVAGVINNYQLFVSRFTPEGSLDIENFNSSGTNPGYIIITVPNLTLNNPSGTTPPYPWYTNSIFGVAIQSTGDIIVSGTGAINNTSNSSVPTFNGFICSLSSSGTLNTSSFGTNGFATIAIGDSTILAGIALKSDDTITVTGTAITSTSSSLIATRYTPAGILDGSFGDNGYIIAPKPNNYNCLAGNLAIQLNDDIILTGEIFNPLTNQYEVIIYRYSTDGILDTSFGSGLGYNTTTIPNDAFLFSRAITLELTEKIIVTGKLLLNGFSYLFAVRYNKNGSLDTSITPSGYMTATYPSTPYNNTVHGYSNTIQSDGKFIIAGQSNNYLFIARYLGGIMLENITPAITSYGNNSTLISKFLYNDFYAMIITDPIARAATISTINVILSTYSSDYSNQPNFNYVSYLYLLEEQLTAAKFTLKTNYPGSSTQLDLFFSYINKRITHLTTP